MPLVLVRGEVCPSIAGALLGSAVLNDNRCNQAHFRLGTAESASRLGVIPRAACPVARQCPQRPEQSKQTKPPAPWNAGAPGQESTQSGDDGRGCYTGGPHEGSSPGTDVLHGELFCLHAKEGEMFKYPTKPGRVARGIPGPTNCVEAETNAYARPTSQCAIACEEK